MRPVLAPAARPLWRGTTTLQLRRSATHGVLVQGLDDAARLVLPLLDGTRTREQVLDQARTAGCPDPEAVLGALHDTGLLVDADRLQVPSPERDERDRLGPDLAALSLLVGDGARDALAARRAGRVIVHGAGRVGGPLAALLAEAGVGAVDVRDTGLTRPEDLAVGGLGPQDLGRGRAEALGARLRGPRSSQPPALVVLTDEVPDQLARVLVREGLPHLLARVDGCRGVVGPLVLPGHATCLRCVLLVEAAIDPDAHQLVRGPSTGLTGPEACHGALAAAVAAQAALQALELLEGGTPGSVGGSLELVLPGWRWRRRTWPPHPGCGCGASTPVPLAATA